jgi:metallo-beta-lactamase class B
VRAIDCSIMRRTLFLLLPVCAILLAQSPGPPFTAKDAARGLDLAKLSFKVRDEIGNFRAPAEPFKIMGNLYFVGVANGECYLLTSPQGDILFGAGFANTTTQVEKNIQALGFKLTDIKVILLNHFHGDQSGGAAELKEKTGAQVMAGFAEVPYLERGGTAAIAAARGATPQVEFTPSTSPFALYPSPQFKNINDYRPVHVDRSLFDGDVIRVGPLSVTAYLAPGHSPSSTSWLYTVRDGGRAYRVFEWCCWEYPDDYRRNPLIEESTVRHTFETWRKVLPVDIYLETGSYAWSGILNQPSGTWQERFAKLKNDNKLWVNRGIFSGLAAAREVSFEQNLAKMKAAEAK